MNALAKDVYTAEVIGLREQLALRTEEVRQLKETFTPRLAFPRPWGLTGAETSVLGALYAARGGMLSKDSLHIATAGLEIETDQKIVDVYICKLRQKLKRADTGIAIETRWGEGYCLPPDSRKRIACVLAGEPLPALAAPPVLLALPPPAPPIPVPVEQPKEAPVMRSQLPAIYVPPVAHTGIQIAAELLAIAQEFPKHQAVIVSAVRELLAPAPIEPSLAIEPATIRRRYKPRKGKKARKNALRQQPQLAPPATKAAPAAAPKPAAPQRLEPVTFHGVTIDTTAGGETVGFKGKSMEIDRRQAQLTALLARAMPDPVNRVFLCNKLFPGCTKESANNSLSSLASKLNTALAGIGLDVVTVHGVGVVLKVAE